MAARVPVFLATVIMSLLHFKATVELKRVGWEQSKVEGHRTHQDSAILELNTCWILKAFS